MKPANQTLPDCRGPTRPEETLQLRSPIPGFPKFSRAPCLVETEVVGSPLSWSRSLPQNLKSLELFVLIVEEGGMAGAGAEVDLPVSIVSVRLAAREERYEAPRLQRTTGNAGGSLEARSNPV